MRQIIDDILGYKLNDDNAKESLNYTIGQAVLSEKEHRLTVNIRLNFVVPFEKSKEIEKRVAEKLSGNMQVALKYTYEKPIGCDLQEAIGLYIEHMIEEINGAYAHITKTIRPSSFNIEGDRLEIAAVGDIACEQLNQIVASKFHSLLKDNLGANLQVSFVNDAEEYAKRQEKIVKQLHKDISHAEQQVAAAAKEQNGQTGEAKSEKNGGDWKNGKNGGGGWQRKDKYTPVEGNCILGTPIKCEPTEISEVTPESGKVAIEGTLFRLDERTVKNDKKLVTMLVSDDKTSICVKAFVLPQKFDDIKANLPLGSFVKIWGEAQLDLYENSTIIMAKSIEKGKAKVVEDVCEEKRVELHAHTKMSAMDGLNEISDLINTAAAWGHSAVAVTDHGVVQAFPDACKAADKLNKKGKHIKIIYGVEGYFFDDSDCINPDGTIDYKKKPTNHIIILAQNQIGLKNLYKIVSEAHLQYFYKKARTPKSLLDKYREGLIVGSACEAGQVYAAVRDNIEEKVLEKIASYYDYLEIQPLVNNQFMIDDGIVADEEALKNINRKIVALGDKLGKPVVATCDAHYTKPGDALYRRILMAGQGYQDIEGDKGLHMRTTDQMLEEFAYLGEEKAYEVVVTNSNLISDKIEELRPVPDGKFPPKIENSDVSLREKCYAKAHSIYGEPLPEIIEQRLEKELNSVIGNGYAVMYVSAQMLVNKSMEDGYLVGSRGSVGSSFAATMAGITEVNPLAPHYICPNCKHLEWGDPNLYDCGVDMSPKDCPDCGTPMNRDGFSIPFETFLGFKGEKEPDIDLNFAGEYQPCAHKYVEEIFGRENVFRAGTIGTIASKTAYGFVKKYFEAKEQPVNKYEIERLVDKCTGVRRTTGQHPGGIIILPRDKEIYEFCPVQHPANDMNTDIITTHFDYHSIDQNLLKLDILGHDVPSMIKHLFDMTGVDPLTVPLNDEKVTSIFTGNEALNIKDPDYKFTHGSFAIPEFGTRFVRQMLDDTQPDKFADLVRISGFSHGTDVWLNNAQEFIRSKQATMKDAISTRDDIMNYLILKGLPNEKAFSIMESVRKGKGVKDEEVKLMQENNVPEWYIESCRRIKYMFPRAHAVAYVMMAYRMAWYKVYYPAEFYAAYFSTKVADFNDEIMVKGSTAILRRIEELEAKSVNITKKEEGEIIVLEVGYEMYSRGYEFTPARLGKSHACKFGVDEGKVILPFQALAGVGENAAKALCNEYESMPFETIEEVVHRTGLNKVAIEALKSHGVLQGLSETDQLSLF